DAALVQEHLEVAEGEEGFELPFPRDQADEEPEHGQQSEHGARRPRPFGPARLTRVERGGIGGGRGHGGLREAVQATKARGYPKRKRTTNKEQTIALSRTGLLVAGCCLPCRRVHSGWEESPAGVAVMLTTLLLTAVLLFPGDEDPPRKPHPLAPSLPALTREEEDKLDRIIDRFIQYDTGKLLGKEGLEALRDFE